MNLQHSNSSQEYSHLLFLTRCSAFWDSLVCDRHVGSRCFRDSSPRLVGRVQRQLRGSEWKAISLLLVKPVSLYTTFDDSHQQLRLLRETHQGSWTASMLQHKHQSNCRWEHWWNDVFTVHWMLFYMFPVTVTSPGCLTATVTLVFVTRCCFYILDFCWLPFRSEFDITTVQHE